MWVWSVGQEDPLETRMATESTILAWRIPWTEEPSGLQAMESDTTEWLTLHGSQLCCGEGACITRWSCEPCYTGSSKRHGSQWRVLTKCGPLEEMANHPRILAVRPSWTEWKGKEKYEKIWHWKMSPPDWKVFKMLLGKSREQLLIALGRMKQLHSDKTDA